MDFNSIFFSFLDFLFAKPDIPLSAEHCLKTPNQGFFIKPVAEVNVVRGTAGDIRVAVSVNGRSVFAMGAKVPNFNIVTRGA